MRTRARRGTTLIEIMMAAAMASIIITTAIAVVAAAVKLKRSGERNLEVQLAASVGAVQIQADLMNAGYRFASAAYAFRHYNNVDGAVALSSPLGAITTGGNCGDPNGVLVAGSDVIEVAEGAQNTALASATSGDGVINVAPLGSNQWRINLITGAPFDPTEAPGSRLGQILLFVDGAGLSCIGRVLASTTPTGADLEMLDRDYLVNGSHDGNYVGANQCPQVGMSVYRLGARTRYFLCDNVPGQAHATLYRQVSGIDGALGAPIALQDGIEDLQVSPRQLNPPGPGVHGGSSCVVAPGSQSYCYCADKPSADSCDGADPTTFITPASFASKVRGARVMLTSISRRRARSEPSLDDVRPAAYDHGLSVAPPDGFARAGQEFSVTLNNLTLVSP